MESFDITEDFKFPIALPHIYIFMSLKNQVSLQTLRTATKIYTVCEVLVRIWLLSVSEIPSCKIQ